MGYMWRLSKPTMNSKRYMRCFKLTHVRCLKGVGEWLEVRGKRAEYVSNKLSHGKVPFFFQQMQLRHKNNTLLSHWFHREKPQANIEFFTYFRKNNYMSAKFAEFWRWSSAREAHNITSIVLSAHAYCLQNWRKRRKRKDPRCKTLPKGHLSQTIEPLLKPNSDNFFGEMYHCRFIFRLEG